jgi:xanthine dehydrogenase YagS FAD-binding subunit
VHLRRDGDKVRSADVWLGSVAPIPWRAEAAEKALMGKPLTDETIRTAADAAVTGATPLPGNAYKVDLVKVVVRRALERLRSAK